MINEIELQKGFFEHQIIESIYFGGGTPSLIKQKEFERIIEQLKKHISLSNIKEFTLEANPEDLTRENITLWERMGVNRLSIGIQSFDENILAVLNRNHKNKDVFEGFKLLENSSISSISIDLIFGLPGQSIENWKEELVEALKLPIQHISCYNLTIEDKTALSKQVEKKIIQVPNDEIQSKMFLFAHDFLERNGFEHYELSNYAKKGHKAFHNSNYWNGVPYLGIGPSAHSFDGEKRWFNICNNLQYSKAIATNNSWFEVEELNKNQQFNEKILSGIRTKNGLTSSSFSDKDWEEISLTCKKLNKEWFNEISDRIELSAQGFLFCDHIARELFKV